MTWRDVFDTDKRAWGHIDRAAKSAYDCGYAFIMWNGQVYSISESGTQECLPYGIGDDGSIVRKEGQSWRTKR